jgi:membrane protease subunit HflC
VRGKRLAIGLLLVLTLVVLASSLYTVSEVEQAIVTQFGEPVGSAITEPGLHAKLPFIQKVIRFDKRWLEWDGDTNQVPTRDKKYILVDTFARWRITDPLRFYQRVRDERGGQSRLDDIIDGDTRNAVAGVDLFEVVRTSDRKFDIIEELKDFQTEEPLAEVRIGRDKLAAVILQKAAKVTPEFGIELVDVRFKRINYIEDVQQKVYERMISERKRIAERSRSEGQGRSAEIRGQKERELKRIQSEAYRKAEEIRGRADAQAAGTYARAHGQDAEFYQFLRTLEAYRTTLDPNTLLVLSTDSEFLKYLKGP